MDGAAIQPQSVCEDEPGNRTKTIATLAAKLAMRGLQLHELASGGWLISDHRCSLHAPDLRSVSRFLDHGHH